MVMIMKRILSFALALLMVLSLSSVFGEGRTKTPAGQLEGGASIYYVINSAFFQEGSNIIILGQKNYEAYKRYDQPVAITKVDEDLLMPVDAMSKIFQFSYTYDAANGAIHIEDEYVKADLTVGSKDVTINDAAETLGAAPAEIEGVLCVPAVSVGTKVLGLVTGESLGYTYLAYEEAKLPSGATGLSGAITRLTYANKYVGVFEPVYWFEEAQMLMPYRVVIPDSYDPNVPNALVVYLHGSGGNDNRDMDRTVNYNGNTGTWWDFECGEFGFIGLSVNGYAATAYGANADSEDPVTARASELAELEVLAAIEQVKANYNIDENRIFLMGNSMGSAGTTWLACKYPDKFAAISASGLLPALAGSEGMDDMGKREYSKLGDKPFRVVMGSEDRFYPTARATYEELKEMGLNITFRTVVGGYHNTAWSQGNVLTETFQFFADVK